MKILFCSFRYNPTDIDAGSGFDHDYYSVLSQYGFAINAIGPFPQLDFAPERLFARIYKKITGMSYAKFRLVHSFLMAIQLKAAINKHTPAAVFTIWPNFFIFFKFPCPIVYAVDTCLYSQQLEHATYGKLAMKITEWQEKRAFQNTAHVITHSHWSKNIICGHYGVPSENVTILPVPSSLPLTSIPQELNILVEKKLEEPLRLLLVGRVYERKGVDIAIRVVELLNEAGLPAELTVCGLLSEPQKFVKFVGHFKKSNPGQLAQYASLYQNAHLLIHPARFEAAGIAPSEAAAFATPTITNDVGGLGTTVADGISGIVLPKHSPPKAYVEAILALARDSQRYYRLCETTRERYERELNWDVAGKRVAEIITQVVAEHRAAQ